MIIMTWRWVSYISIGFWRGRVHWVAKILKSAALSSHAQCNLMGNHILCLDFLGQQLNPKPKMEEGIVVMRFSCPQISSLTHYQSRHKPEITDAGCAQSKRQCCFHSYPTVGAASAMTRIVEMPHAASQCFPRRKLSSLTKNHIKVNLTQLNRYLVELDQWLTITTQKLS